VAGLLLRELKLPGLVETAPVVAPANLAFQWQREMWDRFHERFDILRGVDLRNAYGTNPWLDRNQVITSIDWAERHEVEESLRRARWDLVVVDEAHRMSARDPEHKTERYRLGELLSEKTDHLLFLTATRHWGDPANFTLFLRLLDPDVYADVRSLQEAMRRHRAPFYLRRTKEALVSRSPTPRTGPCGASSPRGRPGPPRGPRPEGARVSGSSEPPCAPTGSTWWPGPPTPWTRSAGRWGTPRGARA
jgi:SNF2 family DNA or RNA helicase